MLLYTGSLMQVIFRSTVGHSASVLRYANPNPKNFETPRLVLQASLSHMKEGSSVINCASIQGYSPTPQVRCMSTPNCISYTHSMCQQ